MFRQASETRNNLSEKQQISQREIKYCLILRTIIKLVEKSWQRQHEATKRTEAITTSNESGQKLPRTERCLTLPFTSSVHSAIAYDEWENVLFCSSTMWIRYQARKLYCLQHYVHINCFIAPRWSAYKIYLTELKSLYDILIPLDSRREWRVIKTIITLLYRLNLNFDGTWCY